MAYKWESARDWLDDKIADAGEDVLREYLSAILPELDNDTIQDIFQGEMDSDGFFEEAADEEEEDEDDEDDSEPLLEPVRDVIRGTLRIATFEVQVPEDLYPTMDKRREHAIYLVREQASDYVTPASYRARIVKRGYEETYRVVRRSNAIVQKEVSQTTAM